jgi:hypothetical protein
MNENGEIWKRQISLAVRESIGHGMTYSVNEAARLTQLHPGTIYQLARGELAGPERHLPALLGLPEFADRLMTIRGHACAFIGNQDGCEWQAISSLMEGAGTASRIVADRKISNTEEKRLADVLHKVVAKSAAFLARFKKKRMGVA